MIFDLVPLSLYEGALPTALGAWFHCPLPFCAQTLACLVPHPKSRPRRHGEKTDSKAWFKQGQRNGVYRPPSKQGDLQTTLMEGNSFNLYEGDGGEEEGADPFRRMKK